MLRPSIRRLVAGMLEEHGLDPWLLDRDRRLAGRLEMDERRGTTIIKPGPYADWLETRNVERDVRVHWATEVAEALQRSQFGRALPAWAHLVPAVAKSVAVLHGHDEGDILKARKRSYDHMDTPPKLTVTGLSGIPNWVIDLMVEAPVGQQVIAGRDSMVIPDLPDTMLSAIIGKRLHQVVDMPGIAPGTTAGETVILAALKGKLLFEVRWTTLGDPPAGTDMRWMAIALQAPFGGVRRR